MKRIFMVSLLILTVVFVTGCGISKEEYDAAVEEADDLEAELAIVRNDLVAAQTELAAAKTDLAKSKVDLAAAQNSLAAITADRDSIKAKLDEALGIHAADQGDLATAQQELTRLNTSLKAAQPYVDVARVWLEFWNSNYDQTAYSKVTTAVSVTQDSALKTAWDNVRTTTGDAHVAAEWSFINRLLEQLTVTVPKTN
jgi:chromosome segregation ATPase